MTSDPPDMPPLEEPLAELERRLIREYLAAAGYDYESLLARQDEQARRLLVDASVHAASRLTEGEARSHYLRNLHGQP